jgi:hypothetical protein
MDKTILNSRYLSRSEPLRLKNITSLNLANYSNVAISVTLNDVTEVIPAYDNLGFPSAFEIKGDGTCSDAEIMVDFGRGAKTGNAILRYRELIINQIC